MKAATHLIRVEGVNLSAVQDDTDDISVRRGASAMLRTAARGLVATFLNLTPVRYEASVGIFEVDLQDPDPLLDQIADHLSKTYPHVTFVVDAAPLDQGFTAAYDEAWARNRFRQFQQPTIAVPSNTASTAVVCALDRVRPATEKAKQGMQVSPSVNARLNEGRHQRERFLREILGDGFGVETTESLVELSEDSEGRYGNLARKIAVIYLDGNKFGDLKRNYSARPESLRALDNLIQGYRKDFLRQLVESARQDEDFLIRGALRLEILIWGGDEVLLVVPAWKGMETLQRFFEESSDWFVPDDPHSLVGESDRSCNVSEDVSSGQGKRLTHAGGIVFCSHKTPIAESTKAAKALAESVKDFTRQDNRFDYLVLKSIDYPTQEINAFRRIKYGAETVKAMTPLAPFTERSPHLDLEHLPWDKRIKKIAEILDTLPREPLLGIARAWVRSHSSPGKDTPDAFDNRVARLENVNGAGFVQELHQHLLNYFVPDHDPKTGHDHTGWVHLAELWDYLAPSFTSTRRKS